MVWHGCWASIQKPLNGSQQSWHINGKGLFVPAVGVRFFGNHNTHYINRWFMRHPEEQVSWVRGQMVPDVAKICIGSDSGTSLGSLLNIPCQRPILSKKVSEILGLTAKCLFTMHAPGFLFLCRIVMNGSTSKISRFNRNIPAYKLVLRGFKTET